MGRCSRIPPELIFVRRTVGAPDVRQGYGRQEYQTCRCSPGDVSSPDSSLPTQVLQFMGIRPGQAPDPTRALWILAQGHLEGAFQVRQIMAGLNRGPRVPTVPPCKFHKSLPCLVIHMCQWEMTPMGSLESLLWLRGAGS